MRFFKTFMINLAVLTGGIAALAGYGVLVAMATDYNQALGGIIMAAPFVVIVAAMMSVE